MGACYGGSFLLSSLVSGWKSDAFGRICFVRWGLLTSSLAFAAQLLADNIWLLMAVRSAVGLALGIATSALIAHAYEAGAEMGKFSSYGSLGWIFGAVGSAFLKEFPILFLTSSVCCFLAFLLAFSLREATATAQRVRVDLWPVIVRNFRVYLAIFLRHLGATAVWTILPLYLTEMGLGRSWIALLWGINYAVQFLVMRQLERYDENRVFAFGQLLSIGVFVSYAVVRAWRFWL